MLRSRIPAHAALAARQSPPTVTNTNCHGEPSEKSEIPMTATTIPMTALPHVLESVDRLL